MIGNLYISNGDGGSNTQLLNTTVGFTPEAGVGQAGTLVRMPSSGNVTVLNGAGPNTFNLDNSISGDGIGQNIFILNGTGGATTTLTQSIVWGSVTIFNGDGTTATTLAETYVGGSLAVYNGNGPNQVTIDDLSVHTIGGNLSVTGGSGADLVTVTGYGIGGYVYMNTGSGNDTVNIDNTSVAGWTQIIMSSASTEQDTVNVEQKDLAGPTTFTGFLWVWTGAGSDTVKFGKHGDADCFVHFMTGLYLDGGPGTDTVSYIGNGNIFDPGITTSVVNFETVQTSPITLGTAGNFVILSKSGISTTGTTLIVGDIGVSPIAATGITGFNLSLDASGQFWKSSLVTGKVYASNNAPPTPANMTAAVGNMENAYNEAAAVAAGVTELGAGNIGGLTLAPGVYKWSSGLIIPTSVTLSGSATDVWIFQVAGNLDISSNRMVILGGSALPQNIFWQVAGQTTLETGSIFEGIILDKTAIVMNTGATLVGGALAQTAVTLDANDVLTPV